MEKAVIEHNMLATGKIYDNIRFSELGKRPTMSGWT